MAIDMTTVKQIMHNNKEVAKIEDGLGNVLWQKVAEQPYRRLEYLIFDGTCYCASAEHNANDRAYRLDYMQTGWASNNLCYPFGIWTNTAPQNILLTRNDKRYTTTGFEVCRVSFASFGKHPSESYINNRMIAEMRWGTDTTVYYRLRNQSSSSYIENDVGTASGRTGTNTGNWFIGAINDGGGGTYNNANGLLVGRIYEVAIAESNSFDDYGYAYVPCQRKSDGAVGFKQPHTDSFWPLLNKSDGSVVTNVTAHMGPVVDDNWDGVTYTITPSPIAPEWHTIYDNSTGYDMRLWANKQWSTTGKPCNIPAEATKLKITYKASCKDAYMRLSFNTSSNAYNATGSVTKWPVNNGTSATVTTDYTNGHNIVSVIYTTSSSSYTTGYRIAGWRWYRDGTAQTQAPGSDWTGGSLYATLTITKVQAYY